MIRLLVANEGRGRNQAARSAKKEVLSESEKCSWRNERDVS